MNEHAAVVIQQMADKLGTTSQYLWSVLLKQAPVYVVISVIEAVIFCVFIYLYFKFLPKMKALADDYSNDGAAMTAVICIIGGAILSGIFILAIFVMFESAVTALVNPEYWALDKLLSAIKRK